MITTTGSSEQIQSVPVTVDTKGRVRTSRQQRCDILAEFERSGVSAVEFAKRSGIKYSTFAGWLQRHRRSKPQGRRQAVRLLEVVVEQEEPKQPGALVILRLPGGTQIELSNARQVPLAAALVRALQKPC